MNAETPKAAELNLPQAFLLLATNDKDGEPEVPQSVLRAARGRGDPGRAGPARCNRAAGEACQGYRRPPRKRTSSTSWNSSVTNHGRTLPSGGSPCWRAAPNCSVSTRGWRRWASWNMSAKDTLACSGPRGTRRRTTLRRRRSCKRSRPHSAVSTGSVPSDSGPSASGASDPRTTALIALLYAAGLLGKIFPAASKPGQGAGDGHWPSRALADELRMIKLAEAEAVT